MIQKFTKGDIYYYNFGTIDNINDHIERKCRPVLIISNNYNNTFSSNVNVVPITTRDKSRCKHWQVYFNNNDRDQVILCEQVFTISSDSLGRYVGRLDEITLKEVDKALATQFGLNIVEKELNSIEFMKRLDISIENILLNKLKGGNTQPDIQTLTMDEFKQEQKEQISKINVLVDNKISAIQSEILSKINKVDNQLNTYNNELNLILTSLIGLYSNLGKDENKLKGDGVNSILEGLNITSKTDKDKSDKESNIKNNNSLNSATKVNKNHCEPKEYGLNDTSKYIGGNGKNKGVKHSVHAKPFDYSVENCLAFIDECNNESKDALCAKYNLTKKQFTNRKYSVCKWLKEQDVSFKVVRYKRS